MFWKKKEKTKQYLTDFSIQHISTAQINAYILDELYKEEYFSHIGYEIVKSKIGEVRCLLYILPNTSNRAISYFKDRCAGCIEEKVKTKEGRACSWEEWENGFSFVKEYKDSK